jgi:hypothetical protein
MKMQWILLGIGCHKMKTYREILTESSDKDILQDAGFLPREIENILKNPDSEDMQKAKQGYIFIGGDFKQVTSKDVAAKKKMNKAEIIQAKEILKRVEKFPKSDIGAGEMVDLTGIGDSRHASKRDTISRWKWKIKDLENGIARYERQLKRSKGK